MSFLPVHLLRIVRICCQLGMGTNSPYWEKLPNLNIIQEQEQMGYVCSAKNFMLRYFAFMNNDMIWYLWLQTAQSHSGKDKPSHLFQSGQSASHRMNVPYMVGPYKAIIHDKHNLTKSWFQKRKAKLTKWCKCKWRRSVALSLLTVHITLKQNMKASAHHEEY